MPRNSKTLQQRDHSVLRKVDKKKILFAVVSACLLLLGYIGFLATTNFKNHRDLRDAAMKRFYLDQEKRADALGYYFLERKSDLNLLALSDEIESYFVNKSLGMSEEYGLKVNIFMIQKLLDKVIVDRHIQNDLIYDRIVFSDSTGKILADTAKRFDDQSLPPAPSTNPSIYISEENRQHRLMMTVGCTFRNKKAGTLVVWLNEQTLYSNFTDLHIDDHARGAGFIDENNRLQCHQVSKIQNIGLNLKDELVPSLSEPGLSELEFTLDGKKDTMLVAYLPIQNLSLRYIAWVPKQHITGGLASIGLMVAMGILAIMVITGLGLFLWGSNKQQNSLALNNQQLNEEIKRREKAEEELTVQRTLRIRSDRLRSLGEMAAGIAHELNQPLVGVRGYAELIVISLEKNKPLPPETICHYSESIVQQVDRMVHIIDHVRLFARDAGSVEVEVVDLNEIVHSGLNLLTTQFYSYGLLLEKEFAQRPLPVLVNAFSVEEVILNMLSNARYAVEQRQVIEGDAYQPNIRVITAETIDTQNGVSVMVEDNGIGIPENLAERIFDPFFTTKDPDKGTGLGLSICKSIVESFKGLIRYTTVENQGTRFEIIFPEANRDTNI